MVQFPDHFNIEAIMPFFPTSKLVDKSIKYSLQETIKYSKSRTAPAPLLVLIYFWLARFYFNRKYVSRSFVFSFLDFNNT